MATMSMSNLCPDFRLGVLLNAGHALRVKAPSPLLLAFALGLSLPVAAQAGDSACWFENGAVVVPAEIGGVAGDWLLDPSAAHTLLHETRAQMEGLPATFSARARLAGQTFEGVDVTVADLDDRAPGFQTPIAGVIGTDLLRRVVVDLRFAPCRLRLTTGPAGRPARGARPLRVLEAAGVPVVEAAVSDDRRARRGLFAIDLSARASVRLTAAVFQPDRVGAATAPRSQAPGHLRALSFRGELYEQASAALAPDLDPALAGALGTDLWSRWRLRLDIASGRLWLSPE
mgnify:FL=1